MSVPFTMTGAIRYGISTLVPGSCELVVPASACVKLATRSARTMSDTIRMRRVSQKKPKSLLSITSEMRVSATCKDDFLSRCIEQDRALARCDATDLGDCDTR